MLRRVLAPLSYLRVQRRPSRRLPAGVVLALMLAVGAGAGWKVLYPLVVVVFALGTSLARARR